MSGDLAVYKDTPSLFLRAKDGAGAAAVRFYTGTNQERGIIYAGPNTDSLGEVRIRAKNAKGETNGDLIVRHDGVVEVQNLTAAKKVKSVTAEFANTSTSSDDTTVNIKGSQHTPLVLTRNNTIKNLSIGFKVDGVDQKYLGIYGDGDLYFGSYSDHTKNSRVITQAKLDSGLTVGGKTTFSDLATFNAGISGAIEPESISAVTVDLNNLTIKGTDKGSVKYYQCRTAGGGANITNKPDGVGGNFLLRVESIRKVSDSDYINMQTLISGDKGRVHVRFVTNGNWTAWREVVVSGWNQDVTVRSLTSTTPSKLGGGRIDVLGSTSDYGSMNCTVRGVDSSGTNSAWSVGTSVDTGKTLYLKNHRTSSQVLISGDTGSIKLQNGNANKELALTEDSVTSNADIILKNSDDGPRLIIKNSNNSAQSWSVTVWGKSGRESIFEVGNSNGYMFYAQETASGGRNFDFNGDVTCKTLYQTSDQSLKDNIKVIGDATESIRKMNGYTYTFKDDGLPYAGVIAQEVMDALPEAIAFTTLYGKELQGPTTDGNVLREEMKCLSVDYAAVTGLLVQVARETDDRVTALEEENTTLRENLATADTRISTLENQVSELVALVRQLTGSEH
ncbi:tail fiber domain-containing protein [Escherichia coli]|nr:tail fiber domain-containing protein [Escherichia coli]